MDAYDPAYVPPPFGLQNTGAICYLNSFLQALASCPTLTKTVLSNEPYMRRTQTGTAVLAYVRAYCEPQPGPALSIASSNVLMALVADLAARCPNTRFGAGQESASEALMHLLNMMEPSAEPGAAPGAAPAESPITRLFLHRFRCELHCRDCRKVVSSMTDHSVNFNLFHLDRIDPPPATPEAFSRAVRLHVSLTDDYQCEECQRRGATGPSHACRIYRLSMAPEILFCMFNLYDGYGGSHHHPRWFPPEIEFPALDGGALRYILVSQVEHSGSLSGGHYWARALRRDGLTYMLNDFSFSPAPMVPSPSTYIVVYHYHSTRGGAA